MRSVRVARAGTAALIAVGLVALGAGPSSADAQDALDRARRAAVATTYTGTVTVRWSDRDGTHSLTLDVRSAGGVMRVDGPAKLVATSSSRWLFRDGNWDLMSPPTLGSFPVPAPVKYESTASTGPTVAGRPTQLVVLRVGGTVEERWYQDSETGLLLRREQLSAAGAVVRSVGFDAITIGQASATPAPDHSVDLRPHLASTTKKPYVAPATLPGGYQRVAMFSRPGTFHVVYSDGLHGLSMFEQAGRLNQRSVPTGGERVTVGSHRGYQYVYAGGQVVVWQAGGSTYTVVGDGAPDDVIAAARAVPVREGHGFVDRLRRACVKVMQAVSGSS